MRNVLKFRQTFLSLHSDLKKAVDLKTTEQ